MFSCSKAKEMDLSCNLGINTFLLVKSKQCFIGTVSCPILEKKYKVCNPDYPTQVGFTHKIMPCIWHKLEKDTFN